jgi:hypothetical protein
MFPTLLSRTGSDRAGDVFSAALQDFPSVPVGLNQILVFGWSPKVSEGYPDCLCMRLPHSHRPINVKVLADVVRF